MQPLAGMPHGIRVFARPAREFMAREVLTVMPETSVFDIQRMFVEEEIHGAPDAPIAEVAQLMHDQHVHRELVLDDHELVGVITSFDLLRVFTRTRPEPGQW